MKKLTLFFVMAMLLIAFSLQSAVFTDSGWSMTTVNEYGIKYNIWTCTLDVTTADTLCYTARTPDGLDTSRPWELLVNTEIALIEGATLPVWLVGGWSASSTITKLLDVPVLTDCAALKAVESDVKATLGHITIDPNLNTADVANLRVHINEMPNYIIYLLGSSTFSGDVDCVIKIVQLASGK